MWQYTGEKRPPFAEAPGPSQESVWDYPRPPVLDRCDKEVIVGEGSQVIGRTLSALRVLETASPPTYYLPETCIDWRQLISIAPRSFCEWKGEADYFALTSDPNHTAVAWRYRHPSQPFRELDNHVSCYPGRVACFVGEERVRAQEGGFYGGWVTSSIVGPWKGLPGTGHW